MSESKKEKKEEKDLEQIETRGKLLNKITLIIALLLICGSCYGIGFATNFKLVKNTSNASSNKTNSTTKIEKSLADPTGTTECNYEGENLDYLDVTDPLVQETADKIDHALTKYCGVWEYFTDGTFTADEFDENLVFEMAMVDAYKSANKSFGEGTEISKNDFYSAVRRLFGKDFADKYDSYRDHRGCPNFNYDSSKQVFVQQPSACGGTCGPYHQKKIVKAIKSDSELIIYERVVFVNNADSKIRYYEAIKDGDEITNKLQLDQDGLFMNVDSNYNYGSLYKLTFTKEDGNYVFASSEYLG